MYAADMFIGYECIWPNCNIIDTRGVRDNAMISTDRLLLINTSHKYPEGINKIRHVIGRVIVQ